MGLSDDSIQHSNRQGIRSRHKNVATVTCLTALLSENGLPLPTAAQVFPDESIVNVAGRLAIKGKHKNLVAQTILSL